MSREDQYNVTVTVKYGGTEKDLGTFDKMGGGEVDSEETKFPPGGMAEEISLGGRKTVGNVTVSRLYDLSRDHGEMGWLIGGVGKADVTVTKTHLDSDGNAWDQPLVYQGKLKAISFPEPDSESSDAALFELEVSSATVTQNSAAPAGA